MVLFVIGVSNLAFFVAHHVVRLFYEAANTVSVRPPPGFLRKERNMSPTVSKASRIDSRGETIADPISTSLFEVLELDRAISRRRVSPKCIKIRETFRACGRKSEEFIVLETTMI